MSNLNYRGPILLVILDGVGLRSNPIGNAVLAAHTEFLDRAMRDYPMLALSASGESVGLTAGQMGNSEVGHNVIGSGQIVKQGVAKIEDDFSSGKIWDSPAWRGAIDNVKNTGGTLHFSGIFSDGGVHSDIRHLKLMLTQAAKEGIQKVRIHLVLDGRDVAPQSAEKYIKDLEDFIKKLGTFDYRIASGGGRMVFVADRYETDWNIVKYGYDAIVHGKADYYCHSALDAIKHYRDADPKLQDQYLPSFVVTETSAEPSATEHTAPQSPTQSSDSTEPSSARPIGLVRDGDSFIYIDFRADRALEIAQAFTYEDFPYFDRASNRRLNVFFAGMTEYNSDTHVPEHQLVAPVEFHDTLHDFLGQHHVSQLAISETAKFGHITYYFNGNSYDKAPGEEHIKIDSSTRPYNERPWMRAAEITDILLEELSKTIATAPSDTTATSSIDTSSSTTASPGSTPTPLYRFARVNFPNGDMVGHFGDFEATITAMEAIDIQLARLAAKIDQLGGMMIITADHGNAEDLLDPESGQPKTAHSTCPVPCIFYDNTENRKKYILKDLTRPGLANLAATITDLLGLSDPPASWHESLIQQK